MSEPGTFIDEKSSDLVSDSSQDSCQLQIVEEPMSDEKADAEEVEPELPTNDTSSSQYENPRPNFYRDTFVESGDGSMPSTSSLEKTHSPDEVKKRKLLMLQMQLETREMATKSTQTSPIEMESTLTIQPYSPLTNADFDLYQPQYMPSDMEDYQPPAYNPMDGYSPFDVCPLPLMPYTPPPVQHREAEEKVTNNVKPQNGMACKEMKDK